MKAYRTDALGVDFFCVHCVHDLYQLYFGHEWKKMLEKEAIFQPVEVLETEICAQCLLSIGEREEMEKL